jgi:hypothetical protein
MLAYERLTKNESTYLIAAVSCNVKWESETESGSLASTVQLLYYNYKYC